MRMSMLLEQTCGFWRWGLLSWRLALLRFRGFLFGSFDFEDWALVGILIYFVLRGDFGLLDVLEIELFTDRLIILFEFDWHVYKRTKNVFVQAPRNGF